MGIRHLAPKIKTLATITNLHDKNIARRKSALIVLFVTTLTVLVLCIVILVISHVTGYYPFVLNRLAGLIAAALFMLFLYSLMQRGYYFLFAAGILGIYGTLATVMAIEWSIDLPVVPLLFCVLVVISGMAISARAALYVAISSTLILFIVEYATITDRIHPELAWRHAPTRLSDLIAYVFVFTTLGVGSWLFNRQTDLALQQAHEADEALLQEKKLLEVKVEQRTRELQAAQMEKMQQMYRFAQLGQFSTSILHDLSNHLSTMSLDIEGLEEQYAHSELRNRVGRRIRYIDTMIQWAYGHINGKLDERRFSVRQEIHEVMAILRYDARRQHVQLRNTTKVGGQLMLYGDPHRFRQVIANLVSNAIDAYEIPSEYVRCVVEIEARKVKDDIVIEVRDNGVGIPKKTQEQVFQPFYSTKYDGMGVGLFVVRQIIEDYFGGRIELESTEGATTFRITLNDRKLLKHEK